MTEQKFLQLIKDNKEVFEEVLESGDSWRLTQITDTIITRQTAKIITGYIRHITGHKDLELGWRTYTDIHTTALALYSGNESIMLLNDADRDPNPDYELLKVALEDREIVFLYEPLADIIRSLAPLREGINNRKKRKKNVLGWHQTFNVKQDAGNVPLNNEIFNQGFSADGGGSTGMAEDLDDQF